MTDRTRLLLLFGLIAFVLLAPAPLRAGDCSDPSDCQGIPDNGKLCAKGTWNERMVIETSFSMLTLVCHAKKFFHRVESHLWSHCAYLAAMFNIVTALFKRLFPNDERQRSLAEFSL